MAGLMIAIGPKKGMKRESEESIAEGDEPEAMEVTDEQRDAASQVIDAVKKGDSEGTYLALCNVFALHQEAEEKEEY